MTIETSARAGAARTAAPAIAATTRHDSGARLGTVAFAPGLRLVERDDRTLQIGVEPTRRVLVRHPPPGTVEVFRLLARGVPLSMASRRVAVARNLSPDTWDQVVDELLAGGFLVRTAVAGGQGAGGPAPVSLADAVVVISGTGRVASSVATLLAAAGVGHVHLDPDRALRPGDAVPAGPTADDVTHLTTAPVFDPGRRRGEPPADLRSRRPPASTDRVTLAEVVRRARPGVTVHRPAGYVRPGLVVLATDGPPGPELIRRLVTDRQAHLAVHAGELRGVVGPLVLPGRTSCLHCHDLHRRDADSGWPQVLLELRQAVTTPPAVLATTVAALAADQALQHLGGRRPAAVDGTLECGIGEWRVRRRSWRSHPGCFCSLR